MELIVISDGTAAYSYDGSSLITDLGDVNTLEADSIAVFEDDGGLVPGTGSTALLEKYLYIMQGNGTTARRFGMMERANTNVVKTTYCAPTTVINYVGNPGSGTDSLNAPSTLVVGSEVWIRIILGNKNISDPSKYKSYDYVVKTGDVIGDVLTALMTRVNAETAKTGVTAAIIPTNIGMSFTGTAGMSFNVLSGGFLNAADLSDNLTSASVRIEGCGTPAQILDLERKAQGDDGRSDTYENIPGLWNEASKVDLTATYTQYHFTWKNEKNSATFDKAAPMMQELIIAVKVGSAQITALDTIISNAGL